MINGKTTLIAHLGYPTESFKAPLIYNPWFDSKGIDAVVAGPGDHRVPVRVVPHRPGVSPGGPGDEGSSLLDQVPGWLAHATSTQRHTVRSRWS